MSRAGRDAWQQREGRMAAMTSRQRALAALSHQEPDRVPIDLGSHGASMIRHEPYDGARDLWGIAEEPDRFTFTASGLVVPGETFRSRVGADFVDIGLESLEAWEPLDEPDHYRDEWSVTWVRTGDGEPAALAGPLERDDITAQDILDWDGYPAADDPRRYPTMVERVARIRAETDYAIVFDFHYGVVRECQRLRGFAPWLMDLIGDPERAEAIMSRVVDTISAIAEHALDQVGDEIDVFWFADDMGFQDRPYMKPEMYRELVKPYHARFIERVRARTDAVIMMHNDGAIHEMLGDYVEIGVQALNPVQVSADGMGDTAALKREFGDDLVFWGAIDTQRVLPFGTPEEVRDEVRRRIETLAPGGGYVLAPGHNVQAEVPPANVVAMFEAALEYGGYPLS
jgi:uroporphyrinogen decarboxylase